LLANFGYDYRIVAPLGTLSFLSAARGEGIYLRSGDVLEALEQVETFVIEIAQDPDQHNADGGDEERRTALQSFRQMLPAVELLSVETHDAVAHVELQKSIAQRQAAGQKVAYLADTLRWEQVVAQADYTLLLEIQQHDAQPDSCAGAAWRDETGRIHSAQIPSEQVQMPAAVDGIIRLERVTHLQKFFTLLARLNRNRRRGLLFALIPSLINLGGIYFLRFGVVTVLFIDYGVGALGVCNALQPRFQRRLDTPLLYQRNHLGQLQSPAGNPGNNDEPGAPRMDESE